MSEAKYTSGSPAPVGGMPVVVTTDEWTLDYERDATADDSDKTFTVPALEEWHVLWIYVLFTTTADAGTRQIAVEFYDAAANLVAEVRAGATQVADLTRNYTFAAGLADLVAFRDTDNLMTPLPVGLLLQTDWDIRVYDNNAIQVAADDMIVVINYARRIP
ncbi:MAG TPA: hypothetical protein VMY40_01990 [Anaerolineae bacterium]|nr:hypothetical protein [Anaerolineae bacterium]